MKFRYYITDLHSGSIVGTNDTEIATKLSGSEDFFVVDTETGEWITPNGPVVLDYIFPAMLAWRGD